MSLNAHSLYSAGDQSWVTWYNGKAYADFIENHGYKVKHHSFVTGSNTLTFPVAHPTVWTFFKNTKIPLPPIFGKPHSSFFGILGSETITSNNLFELVEGLSYKIVPLQKAIQFIQPSLGQFGLLPHLEDFASFVHDSQLASDQTKTRVLTLPEASHIETLITTSSIVEEDLSNQLISSYHSKRRYDIRRALKLGREVVAEVIDSDEKAFQVYSSIMPMHKESSQRTGIGGHTLDYWLGFSKAMREQGGYDLVSRVFSPEGEVESVVVVHILGKSAFYRMNSSSIAGNKSSANPLNLHSAITLCSFLGAKYFELGRTSESDNEKSKSIYEYKSQFGGDEYPVVNFRANLTASAAN